MVFHLTVLKNTSGNMGNHRKRIPIKAQQDVYTTGSSVKVVTRAWLLEVLLIGTPFFLIKPERTVRVKFK